MAVLAQAEPFCQGDFFFDLWAGVDILALPPMKHRGNQ